MKKYFPVFIVIFTLTSVLLYADSGKAEIQAMIADPAAISKVLGYKRNAMPAFTLTPGELKAITKDTYGDLQFIFELAEKYNIPKVYISHLVYSGRGLKNLDLDLSKEQRITAVNYILDKAFEYHEENRDIEIVTGNMEMDAILFYDRFDKKYPEHADEMKKRFIDWGGNSAGRKLLNIDSEGFVKPDPFFPVKIGNILKQDFSDIRTSEPIELLQKLRIHPRELGGKCADCQYLNICNGGSKSRAYAIYGELWAEDPPCYLTEEQTRGDT